ncbi:hypothetical protein FH972_006295 [Carpinus fangiana]|uniref:F-box domain-containing protein n=1 Tax=Carpinus fangiana TaxID=176857 RepID=A0A5N6QTP7_9ROSI|nr:hypothetical protein FH972_006295 [Carpinus fangiana]
MATGNEAVDSFYVLPEDCIASVLSFTTPSDACSSSSVSTNFRSAAETDAVWERFLPPQYRSIISRSADSSSLSSSSKKQLYLRLCDHPLLIDDGRKSFWLEKRSGKICYMLSPKDLVIVWMETPCYWRWTSLHDARFAEVAELVSVCWLEIRGKINTCMLSPATLYTAYLVFKVTTGSFGFEDQPVEVAVGVVGSDGHKRKRSVFLDTETGRRQGNQTVPAARRGDGWLEIELGEFFNGGDADDVEVEMSVLEVKGGNWKGGLIVQGFEIRPKIM